jgi:anhydro-N-acetylmuramic acid kinase
VAALSVADGAATLTSFTVAAVARAVEFCPVPPRQWLVTGGGRHNPEIMRLLADVLEASVRPVEDVGWDGDALEAQAFAYLAVRSLAGRPISWPGTTGVPAPLTGGQYFSSKS